MGPNVCLLLASLLFMAGCDRASNLRSFSAAAPYRAWQGVAVDAHHVYVLTDRNETFALENIISVHSHEGELIAEHRQAYSASDSEGNFMSFGDGNVIDGRLYVTAYNFNSGSKSLESRIVVFSLPEVRFMATYEIGDGAAESVTEHAGSYWVTYHDEMKVRRFNLDFEPLRSYTLSQPMGEYGGYQGAYWEEDDFLVQMHGPNEAGLTGSKGLDRYALTDERFVFINTAEPPGYGTGQGVAMLGRFLIQNDRPGNSIVVRERS